MWKYAIPIPSYFLQLFPFPWVPWDSHGNLIPITTPVPMHTTTFCVAGSSVWNSLPDSLWNPVIGGNSFIGFTTMRYINRVFTYLLIEMSISLYHQIRPKNLGCPTLAPPIHRRQMAVAGFLFDLKLITWRSLRPDYYKPVGDEVAANAIIIVWRNHGGTTGSGGNSGDTTG